MILSEFFQLLGEEIARLVQDSIQLNGTSDQLRRQLRIMYGRGEVSREAFFRLLAKVNQGQYIEGELKTLQRQARQHMDASSRALAQQYDAHRGLETVYLNRARLEEVRAALAASLLTMQNERDWLARQAEDFYSRARDALPDEAAARADLEIRQRLLARQAVVEERMRTLQMDLRRVDWLELQLRSAEGDLLVNHSSESLLREELGMRRQLGR